jgi:hypothetical protein
MAGPPFVTEVDVKLIAVPTQALNGKAVKLAVGA